MRKNWFLIYALCIGFFGSAATGSAYDGDWAAPLAVVGPTFQDPTGIEAYGVMISYANKRIELRYKLHHDWEKKAERAFSIKFPPITETHKGSIEPYLQHDQGNMFQMEIRVGGKKLPFKQERRFLFDGQDHSRQYPNLDDDWWTIFSKPAPDPNINTTQPIKSEGEGAGNEDWSVQFVYHGVLTLKGNEDLTVSYRPVVGDPIDRTLMQMDSDISLGVNGNISELCLNMHQMRLVYHEASKLIGKERRLPYDAEMLDFDIRNPVKPDELYKNVKLYLKSETPMDLISSCTGEIRQLTYENYVWQAPATKESKTLKRIWFLVHQRP